MRARPERCPPFAPRKSVGPAYRGVVESVEMMFERTAGFPDVVFGNERAKQLDGREQPARFHAHIMHRFFGKRTWQRFNRLR